MQISDGSGKYGVSDALRVLVMEVVNEQGGPEGAPVPMSYASSA